LLMFSFCECMYPI